MARRSRPDVRSGLRGSSSPIPVLRHYGLKLGDFEGQSYVLRSATGRQELVPHLPGMWAAAERLAGRACDPLDPALIAALEDG